MSKVIAGRFSPGRYEYMASLAAAGFKKIARARKVRARSIQAGAALDVKELLELIVGAAGDIPGDPEMGKPAYDLAAKILEGYCGSLLWEERKRHFVRYLGFAMRLGVPRDLGEADVTTAKELEKFFTGLHAKAVSIGYEPDPDEEDDE